MTDREDPDSVTRSSTRAGLEVEVEGDGPLRVVIHVGQWNVFVSDEVSEEGEERFPPLDRFKVEGMGAIEHLLQIIVTLSTHARAAQPSPFQWRWQEGSLQMH